MDLQEHVSLSLHTTLRLGGPARYFCEATSVPDLREALTFAREQGLPVYILGEGSNVLFSDEGFPGLVIKVALMGEAGLAEVHLVVYHAG